MRRELAILAALVAALACDDGGAASCEVLEVVPPTYVGGDGELLGGRDVTICHVLDADDCPPEPARCVVQGVPHAP